MDVSPGPQEPCNDFRTAHPSGHVEGGSAVLLRGIDVGPSFQESRDGFRVAEKGSRVQVREVEGIILRCLDLSGLPCREEQDDKDHG